MAHETRTEYVTVEKVRLYLWLILSFCVGFILGTTVFITLLV